MKTPPGCELLLTQCAGITSYHDVVKMLMELERFGLFLGVGPWGANRCPTPTTDIEATLAEGHFSSEQLSPGAKAPPESPLRQVEAWVRGLVYAPRPQTYSSLDVVRRGGNEWDVDLAFAETGRTKAGLSFSEFADQRGELVERVGHYLYSYLRPTLALIIWSGDETFDIAPPTLKRRVSVGWRTWFGPDYVSRYGRELLLGIPNRAADLDDGGVFHVLECSAEDVISEGYIRPYLAIFG